MKHRIARVTLPVLLSIGTLGLSAASVTAAGASTMMATHTWHGTVAKVGAMMGKSESFRFTVGTTTYTVDYKTSTKFVMGMASQVKAGAKVTVTGTRKGTVITASKLSI